MKRVLTPAEQSLVAHAQPMVPRLAAQYARRNASVHVSDFESAGHEALVLCIDRHRPEDGTFEQFAFRRVCGAMQDVARKAMRVLSRERARSVALSPVDLDDAPRDMTSLWEQDEADHRGPLLRDLRLQIAAFTAAELEAPETGEDAMIDAHARALAMTAIRSAVAELPPNEQAVYHHLYREETPVAEAAAAIGIEERSVLRISARIRKKLAEKLEPLVEGWRTPAPA
jgi:RNA polymerase sigma factor (sigma-70 family)